MLCVLCADDVVELIADLYNLDYRGLCIVWGKSQTERSHHLLMDDDKECVAISSSDGSVILLSMTDLRVFGLCGIN